MKKKIGIIGNGFVGNSIAFGFSPTHEIRKINLNLTNNFQMKLILQVIMAISIPFKR